MLTKEFIDKSKKKLIEEKARLEGEYKDLSKGLDFGHDPDHGDERGEETEQLENNESVAEDYSVRLADIDEALRKIKDGDYGRCDRCHKDIEEQVLKVDPESRLCESCKAVSK